MQTIKTIDDFKDVLNASNDKLVFLFKHSTSCNISAAAWMDFHKFSLENNDVEYFKVHVIESRQLSNHIESETGIRHQSPQVLVFRNGEVIWDESHWRINDESLSGALNSAAV